MIKVIGIDPDMRKPGVVECVDGEFKIEFYAKGNYTTSALIEDVQVWINDGYFFAIEDVNAINTIYAKNRRSNQAIQSRIAQNVGMVKAAGTILIVYIKNNAKVIAELTDYTGRTNEDTRDAYWIAHYAYNKLKSERNG